VPAASNLFMRIKTNESVLQLRRPRRQRILISTACICTLYRSSLLHYDAFATAVNFYMCAYTCNYVYTASPSRVYERSAPRKMSLRVFPPCQISVKFKLYFIAPVLIQKSNTLACMRQERWGAANGK
jgi:hypothetical protein